MDRAEASACPRMPPGAEPGTAGTALRPRWRRDAIVVILGVVLAYGVCARYNVTEALRRLTRPYEYLQLDELPVVMLLAALGLVWFAWRRNREARSELRQRQRTEARLAATLEDNRRLARHFVDTQEAERRKLARELHDELGQYLNAIKLDAVAVGNHATQAVLRSRAQGIVDSVDHLLRVVKNLIRRFRPVALDELGLAAALECSLDHWRPRLPQTRLHLDITGDIDHCGEPSNLAVYRLVQEGLTNISRHAQASQVRIRLDRAISPRSGRDELRLSIEDDGVGADLRAKSHGLGLVGMRERTEMLGGEFGVSSAPGRGFSLRASVPAVVAGAPS